MKAHLLLLIFAALFTAVNAIKVRITSGDGPERIVGDDGFWHMKLTANERFLRCCKHHPRVLQHPEYDHGMKETCYAACNYDQTRLHIAGHYLSGRCNNWSLMWMLNCATQHTDLSDCCRRKGIDDKCVIFCQSCCVNMHGVDLSYLRCADFENKYGECIAENEAANPVYVKTKVRAPTEAPPSTTTTTNATVEESSATPAPSNITETTGGALDVFKGDTIEK